LPFPPPSPKLDSSALPDDATVPETARRNRRKGVAKKRVVEPELVAEPESQAEAGEPEVVSDPIAAVAVEAVLPEQERDISVTAIDEPTTNDDGEGACEEGDETCSGEVGCCGERVLGLRM
jgi:hypothetical protein